MFKERSLDLQADKKKVRQCNVPSKYPGDPSFGQWCNNKKFVCNQLQQGKTPDCNG
jgi:hypothetical protein